MAIHSSTTIPPPLQSLEDNSSATVNLDEVLKFIKLNPPLSLNLSIKIRFGIITGLMVLIDLLYLIRLVQAFLDRDYRIIERNRNGYLNPNVEVLVPIFAILNSTLGLCSIISMQHDGDRYLSRLTLTTQITSYAFLFFCAVTRVWKTLSIIPTVPVQVTPFRRTLLTSGLPPSLFNALVVLVYISFPLATLPLALKVSNQIANLGKEAFELVPIIKLIVAQYQNAPPGDTTATTLIEGITTTLQSQQHLIRQLAMWWRIICVIYLLYCLSLFIVFNYASARLYSTLTIQIQILSEARRRFARMASAGMRSFDDEARLETSSPVQLLTPHEKIMKSLQKIKESLWAECQDQSEIMEFWDSLESCTENAELARKFKMSMRYRTVVWWQWLCTSLTFSAFLVLTFCLSIDVFSAHDVPHVKTVLIVHEWADWAWTLPGSALAFLACCVALMPHSDLGAEPNVPRDSIHKQSPREQRFQGDLSRASLESDTVKLRSYTSFLPKDPPSSTKGTIVSEFKLPGRKIWQKHQASKPDATSPDSQRARKFSIFSLVEDEKVEEKKIQSPEAGFHIHQKEPSGVPYCFPSLHIESDRIAPLTNQVTSDVNIIKSLRDRDS